MYVKPNQTKPNQTVSGILMNGKCGSENEGGLKAREEGRKRRAGGG